MLYPAIIVTVPHQKAPTGYTVRNIHELHQLATLHETDTTYLPESQTETDMLKIISHDMALVDIIEGEEGYKQWKDMEHYHHQLSKRISRVNEEARYLGWGPCEKEDDE